METKKTMNQEMINNKIARRLKIIEYIYTTQCLYNEIILKTRALKEQNFSQTDIDVITIIKKNEIEIIKICSKFLKNTWKWERCDALTKAILIYGCFEMIFLKTDHKIIINEMVEYSKYWLLDDKYKFINGVLQNVSYFCAKLKNKKN